MVGAQNFLGGAGEDALQNVHHAVQIGECLIQLAGGELRIVLGVHALVAEDAAHLVDALHAAHDQALQVQLRGDAHVHVDVLGVVVRDEGTGVGAAGDGAQHRRLHLHEAQAIQIAAQIGHELAADLEVTLALGVHDKIHVPLTVADLLVGKAVELLGQGAQRLAQQRDLPGADGHLAPLGAEHLALDAHNIADVVFLEAVIVVLIHLVLAGVDLDAAGLILQIAEGYLAHAALAHEAAGHGYLGALHGVEVVFDVLGVVRHVEFCDLEGVAALILQGLELLTADAQQFTQVLLLCLVAVGFVCHFAALLCILPMRTHCAPCVQRSILSMR